MMREVSAGKIVQIVRKLAMQANFELGQDVIHNRVGRNDPIFFKMAANEFNETCSFAIFDRRFVITAIKVYL